VKVCVYILAVAVTSQPINAAL